MTGRISSWLVAASLVLAGALSGCSDFPELDAAQTPGLESADYPKLVPLGPLLTGPEPQASLAMVAGIEGRVAGLKAKAARLRRVQAAPQGVSQRLAQLRQKAAALRAQ